MAEKKSGSKPIKVFRSQLETKKQRRRRELSNVRLVPSDGSAPTLKMKRPAGVRGKTVKKEAEERPFGTTQRLRARTNPDMAEAQAINLSAIFDDPRLQDKKPEDNWQNTLVSLVMDRDSGLRTARDTDLFNEFVDNVAKPALEELTTLFKTRLQRDAKLVRSSRSLNFSVKAGGVEEIYFRIVCKSSAGGAMLPMAEVRVNRSEDVQTSYFRVPPGDVKEITRENVIACFLGFYRLVK